MKHTKCYIPEYPRPQFVRADWQNLYGEWNFGFGEETNENNALAGKLPRKIIVPFSYQTKASGIGLEEHHSLVWYSHKVSGKAGKRTILIQSFSSDKSGIRPVLYIFKLHIGSSQFIIETATYESDQIPFGNLTVFEQYVQ